PRPGARSRMAAMLGSRALALALVGPPALVSLATALFAAGCASAPEHVAFENKVFYQYDTLNPAVAAKALETAYPPLATQEARPLPQYVGISLMNGAVHISRPRDWVIRAGSTNAEHRWVEYVSPNEYMVAIYETVESPSEPWHVVMGRYEDQAKKNGAELLG